ncbi:MAG: DnaD domain protein [Lachnospiraceae bacterium]|nr:DnaD domain protein [Lachnospiraceae bacterium]
MSMIKLYAEECDPGVTLISNVFIDYYLKDANDAQLKVYMYLVRHISNHKPFEISNIADEFNHTETDVIRSLKYWEQKQVISLEYDARNNIVGIELHNIDEDMINQKNRLHLLKTADFSKESELTVVSERMTVPETKFTASDLVEMSKDSEWVAIRSVAESYLERTLSANDLQILAHIYKDLGFQAAAVDSLLEKCLTQGKKTMRSIKKIAEEDYTSNKLNPSVSAIMNALGKTGAPNGDELAIINSWLDEMNLELILEGCKKAAMSTSGNRIKYACGIFRNWKEKNIKTIEDMAGAEEAFRAQKEAAKKPVAACKAPQRSVTSSTDMYRQYKKSNYDFEAMERELRTR